MTKNKKEKYVTWEEMNMENAKNVKSLKKQLAAAIAMVLVAAIALASSTYAWFVSNNSVKATTTNISAQSNSAYLVIDTKKTNTESTNAATAAETVGTDGTYKDVALYPAQWAKTIDTANYQFETAYAEKKSEAAEKENTRFAVGTPDEAVTADYALLNTFYVGTGEYDGEFTNLKVSNMTVTATGEKSLKTAMRLLVMAYKSTDAATASGWAVVKYDGSKMVIESQSGTDGVIYADQFGKKEGDVVVKVYAYYDGADSNVYTDNLGQISGSNTCGATVTFDATPKEYGKTTN